MEPLVLNRRCLFQKKADFCSRVPRCFSATSNQFNDLLVDVELGVYRFLSVVVL